MMLGEQPVHGIWWFAEDFGLSALEVVAPVSTRTRAPVTNLLSDAGVRLCHATDSGPGVNRLDRALEVS